MCFKYTAKVQNMPQIGKKQKKLIFNVRKCSFWGTVHFGGHPPVINVNEHNYDYV